MPGNAGLPVVSASPFNEDSRVKIPALLHLVRLGWRYLSLKGARWDTRNNIFPDVFEAALLRINPGLKPDDVPRLLDAINLDLQNDDVGRAFHRQLTARSGVRRARELNQANANLAARYRGDVKLMRVHKRLLESHRLGGNQSRLHAALSGIKRDLDNAVLGSRELLGNRAFFERSVMPVIVRNFRDSPPERTPKPVA